MKLSRNDLIGWGWSIAGLVAACCCCRSLERPNGPAPLRVLFGWGAYVCGRRADAGRRCAGVCRPAGLAGALARGCSAASCSSWRCWASCTCGMPQPLDRRAGRARGRRGRLGHRPAVDRSAAACLGARLVTLAGIVAASWAGLWLRCRRLDGAHAACVASWRRVLGVPARRSRRSTRSGAWRTRTRDPKPSACAGPTPRACPLGGALASGCPHPALRAESRKRLGRRRPERPGRLRAPRPPPDAGAASAQASTASAARQARASASPETAQTRQGAQAVAAQRKLTRRRTRSAARPDWLPPMDLLRLDQGNGSAAPMRASAPNSSSRPWPSSACRWRSSASRKARPSPSSAWSRARSCGSCAAARCCAAASRCTASCA